MRQCRRLLLGTAVVATAVGLAGAAPAAASKAGCIKAVGSSKLANGHSQSGKAIVLRKGGKLYGCAFAHPRKNELPGQDDGGRILRGSVVVKGRFAAYGSHYGHDPVNTIVFSAKLWNVRDEDRQWASSADFGDSENVDLTNLQLRPNGSIVWMFSWPTGDPGRSGAFSVVLGIDHNGPQHYDNDNEDDQDQGSDPEHPIRLRSLRLIHDGLGDTGWGVTWAREGKATPRVDVH
jgi:hypothetical protein